MALGIEHSMGVSGLDLFGQASTQYHSSQFYWHAPGKCSKSSTLL